VGADHQRFHLRLVLRRGESGAPCFTVSFGAFGIIRVWRGYPGTLLVSSAPGAFTQSQWFYCEIGGVVDGVGGAVEVRVNTQPVIALLSANTDGGTGRGLTDAVIVRRWHDRLQSGLPVRD
jgi:hypothetical protein